MGKWREVQHTADLAIQVWGDDLADLFQTAAQGMFSLVAEAGERVVYATVLRLTAPDVEGLLVDWLSELLYLYEEEGAVLTDVEFAVLTGTALEANVTGYAVERRRAHIKAVTYHLLAVADRGDGYETEIVFDV